MICSRCQQNIAVVFINKIENGKQTTEGLCLKCARELGIKPLEQMMDQFGLSGEEIDDLTDEMEGLMESLDISDSMTLPPNFGGEGEKGKAEKNTKKQKNKNKQKSMLDTYGTNLTEKASKGELDCVIGREKEIERVIHILNRRTKNNPVLLGEPGVGKTAVAEGIAISIAKEEVPPKLFGYQVYLIDFTALLAGTQFRGQFEQRLKNLITEAKERKNVILVIDELHNIVAAGDAEGAMNAANILKPALARGEVRVIGATTLNEYRKHIEKDSALERRFAPVIINEPTETHTVEILKGLKPYYETYHSIILTDEAIDSAVKLSKRYIPERFLPDKAIDIIDECGSKKNLENKKLYELNRLNIRLASLMEKKEILENPENPDTPIDYQELADIKLEEINIRNSIDALNSDGVSLPIYKEDIVKAVEVLTGIPVTDLTDEDTKKLINLDERLKKRIVGQDSAVKTVATVIRRSRAGLTKKKKPASFIFVGPTGVGKTELVKTLSKELFGTEEAIVRFDMSEYMEKHTVSKLIGSPPGYVGYDDAGLLTEKIRRRPYSIILLDEIEKAHPDVFNILLQVLDDGKLTDSHGKTVHFENTVIIMTSNAGSDYKNSAFGFIENESKATESKTLSALKEFFRPEFLNRIDEIVPFSQLSKETLKGIVDIMLSDLSEEIKDKGISIEADAPAKDYLSEKGYDVKFGARPLKRLIQKEIESELADFYINGLIKRDSRIMISSNGDSLTFNIC